MYFQILMKLGSVFVVLSLISTSLSASSKTEENATYIYLPEIPQIEAVAPVPIVASKPVKALPVITVVPKVKKKIKTINKNQK